MTTFSVNSNLWALVPFTAHNLTLVTFLWKVVSRVLVSSLESFARSFRKGVKSTAPSFLWALLSAQTVSARHCAVTCFPFSFLINTTRNIATRCTSGKELLPNNSINLSAHWNQTDPCARRRILHLLLPKRRLPPQVSRGCWSIS